MVEADPTGHDEHVRRIADGIARRLTDLVDGLMDDLTGELAATGDWSEEQHERVREAVRQLALGFVRWLRIGDLEANHAERLRRLVATPLPGTRADEANDTLRSVRMDATDLMADALGLEDDGRRVVDRELEAYLGFLQPRELRLTDEDDEIDAWLARIDSGPRDVR